MGDPEQNTTPALKLSPRHFVVAKVSIGKRIVDLTVDIIEKTSLITLKNVTLNNFNRLGRIKDVRAEEFLI
jgi:hypothetical protein